MRLDPKRRFPLQTVYETLDLLVPPQPVEELNELVDTLAIDNEEHKTVSPD